MGTRVAALALGLAALGAGCDSGSNDAENGSKKPPTTDPSALPPDIVEACREIYKRLPPIDAGIWPPPPRDATTEEAFVERCVARASGRPDPGLPQTS